MSDKIVQDKNVEEILKNINGSVLAVYRMGLTGKNNESRDPALEYLVVIDSEEFLSLDDSFGRLSLDGFNVNYKVFTKYELKNPDLLDVGKKRCLSLERQRDKKLVYGNNVFNSLVPEEYTQRTRIVSSYYTPYPWE